MAGRVVEVVVAGEEHEAVHRVRGQLGIEVDPHHPDVGGDDGRVGQVGVEAEGGRLVERLGLVVGALGRGAPVRDDLGRHDRLGRHLDLDVGRDGRHRRVGGIGLGRGGLAGGRVAGVERLGAEIVVRVVVAEELAGDEHQAEDRHDGAHDDHGDACRPGPLLLLHELLLTSSPVGLLTFTFRGSHSGARLAVVARPGPSPGRARVPCARRVVTRSARCATPGPDPTTSCRLFAWLSSDSSPRPVRPPAPGAT